MFYKEHLARASVFIFELPHLSDLLCTAASLVHGLVLHTEFSKLLSESTSLFTMKLYETDQVYSLLHNDKISLGISALVTIFLSESSNTG